MTGRSVLVFGFALSLAPCLSQAPADSTAAYDRVQQRREQAERLWRQKDPLGIEMLRQVLADLDTPLIRDLAQGNPYLLARGPNVHYDLAIAYALRGAADLAITELEDVIDSGGF